MCNSFVIGDLVIDHAIFVAETTPNHQQIQNERIFKVLRRTDMAGGAANCARILAALSSGQTLLWGLIGSSHWGSVRKILEQSQEVDGSAPHHKIEFRGISDETEAQMNTITRLIIEKDRDGNSAVDFGHRFDEAGHLHVPSEKRMSLLHYLHRCLGKREHLDVIIINDLDMGCLTADLVVEIAQFASENNIPLFVDPKYEIDKYKNIKGTAIMPNLAEWCRLVGDDHEKWIELVKDPKADLSEMAYRSFKCFGGFDYYVIKCDKHGVVFIGPSDKKDEKDRCVIYRITPNEIAAKPQLGCGDVMTGVFAMEFSKLVDRRAKREGHHTLAALRALLEANVAVSCYLEMPWHRMPLRDSVLKAQEEGKKRQNSEDLRSDFKVELAAKPRKGVMFFPKERIINLSDYKTAVPDWFSCEPTFGQSLSDLAADLQKDIEDWADGKPLHLILTGPPGSGKTAVVKKLADTLGLNLAFIDVPTTDPDSAVSETSGHIKEALKRQQHAQIVVIDEALKRGCNNIGAALNWLQAATARHVRLLLVDTRFLTTGFLADEENREVVRRCVVHTISGINERPRDISLTIAGLIFANAPHLESVELSGDFLLAFTNRLLEDPTVGSREEEIRQALKLASKQNRHTRSLTLSGEHLPQTLVPYADKNEMKVVHQVRFNRNPASARRKSGQFPAVKSKG